jgi:hypothetical protein
MDDLMGAGLLRGGAEGFIRGMQDADDRKFKQMEFDTKLAADQEQKDRQRRMDEAEQKRTEFQARASAREKGFQTPTLAEGQSIMDTDPSQWKVDKEFLAAKASADPLAQAIKGMQYKKEISEAEQRAKGMKLPPDKVLSVQQGAQIPKQLSDIETTLKQNEKLFGPVQGRTGEANPYDTASQTVDAQFRSAAQSFGRYMEGGVLRKEDEDKYRKMFPKLSDTPDVARNKLAIVRKLLVDKQNADTQALSAQGYDTSGFQQLAPAKLPGLLTGGGKMADGMMSESPVDDKAAKLKRLEELKRKAAGG